MSEEQPIAISTAALVMLRISDVVSRSDAISGVATRSDVLRKVTTKVFQLTMKRMRHFRAVLRDLGFGLGEGIGVVMVVSVGGDIVLLKGAFVTSRLGLGLCSA